LEVLGPIIGRIVVLVMNYFRRQQRPSKDTFANDPMLSHIAVAVAVWVIWHIQKNVSALVHCAATLPARMFRAIFRPPAAHLKAKTLASLIHSL